MDESGTLVGKYEYSAYGKCTVLVDIDNIATINPFRFKCYYYDVESDMYYCHTRYFVPEWGRWLNADTTNYLKLDNINGMNLFAYCCNDPVNSIDPNGTWSLKKFFKALAAVAIVVVAAAVAVATAGTAAGLIAAGAAIGGAVGGTINGVSSAVIAAKNGEDVFDAFADGLFSGTVTGALSGAVAASPLGLGGQVIFNTALSGGQYLVETTINGGEFNLGDFLVSTLSGTLAGFAGGAGSMAVGAGLKGVVALNEVLKTSLRKSIATPIWKSMIGTFFSTINNVIKSF